ncbi:MAG: ATP-binding protein [Gemmatimonadales bacterium]
MATHDLFGHAGARSDLSRALTSGRLPQVLLVTGEEGVGKQRFALWLAELALCKASAGQPCGSCLGCRRVRELAHPDLHWFIPVARPKSSDPDKQIDEVRDALGELYAARREKSTYAPPDGMAMHGVASARLILKTAGLTTVEGGRRVLIIGHADRLVPQEASQEAANALLKFLEEPPASALIILTTTEPGRVLPTIRSRAIPVRLGRLSDVEVAQALQTLRPDLSADDRRRRAAAAEGSIGRALSASVTHDRLTEAEQLLETVKQGGAGRFERILKQAAWQARGDFTDLLDALADSLGGAARARTGGAAPARRTASALDSVDDPRRLLDAMGHVDRARERAQGNLNPQLILATLTAELGETLWA